MTMRLLAQCADCLSYFQSERREGSNGPEYFLPAHDCMIGSAVLDVSEAWFPVQFIHELSVLRHTPELYEVKDTVTLNGEAWDEEHLLVELHGDDDTEPF